MSDALIARITDALFLEHTRTLKRLGFNSLVRETPDEHDLGPWRRQARAVVSELDLTDEDARPDRVVMSFWRFDEAMRQAREEAWDDGHEAGWRDRDEGFDTRPNPHSL